MEAVFRHYAPQLSALLHRGLTTRTGRIRPPSPFEVGSLVQEVFARAFAEKARASYDGQVDYLQYRAAIARNELINSRRTREDSADSSTLEAVLLAATDASAMVSTPPVSPEVAAEERELSVLITAFLSTRDGRERDVYRARFEQALTQEEAAASLGLTRIQVRRVEARLRRDLFAHLKDSGYLDRAAPATSSLVGPLPSTGADS